MVQPGTGKVELVAVPYNDCTLRTLIYKYPLKLVAPCALRASDNDESSVQTLYLLSYGGGLVAGDSISLDISLGSSTRLVLLTQGSTKIFKTPAAPAPDFVPNRAHVSEARQELNVTVDRAAGLCYLPDPVQPFADSAFRQGQIYRVVADSSPGAADGSSVCALDWVCRGRGARDEDWHLSQYHSKTEVWLGEKLLLRDSLELVTETASKQLSDRMADMGVMGTLVLHGRLFANLAAFFSAEYRQLPQIGARNWDNTGTAEDDTHEARQREEAAGLLWTVSTQRTCTVVKFGAYEIEGARRWLKKMLTAEGSVPIQFGERALLCLS